MHATREGSADVQENVEGDPALTQNWRFPVLPSRHDVIARTGGRR
jgi:hypothetical protein